MTKIRHKPFEDGPEEITRLAFFLNSFYKETDRGAALMPGSIIEEVLKEILLNFLMESKSSQDLLQGFNAPLGTFNSKILAAYSLGLIEETEYKEIEIIRKIRNEFGHSFDEISLDSQKIKAQVEKFPFQGKTTRVTFNQTVANLLGELLWRSYHVQSEKRVQKTWPNKSGFLKREM